MRIVVLVRIMLAVDFFGGRLNNSSNKKGMPMISLVSSGLGNFSMPPSNTSLDFHDDRHQYQW